MKKCTITVAIRSAIVGVSLAALCITSYAADRYYVQFKDKNDSPFSIEKPEEFLSEKAIERRKRLKIEITEEDLPVNKSYLEAIEEKNFEIKYPLKWFNGAVIIAKENADIEEIKALEFVDPGSVVLVSNSIPDSTLLRHIDKFSHIRETVSLPPSKQPNTRKSTYDYGYAQRQIEMLNGIELHEMGFDGEGITIAVLDAGFGGLDTIKYFDSLRVNNQIKDTISFVGDELSVYQSSFHGMSVMSCIAGNIPGEIVGTAPKADFYLVKTEWNDSEYVEEEYNWARGAEYADSVGADVINSSLGYTEFDDSTQNHIYLEDLTGDKTPITRAANKAASKGIIVCNSAGNSGSSEWRYIGAPADGYDVLALGAVDSEGVIASFSSWGPAADGRIKPDVVAQGRRSACVYVHDSLGVGIFGLNGTSFSSPISAGMAACLRQVLPVAPVKEIYRRIQLAGSLSENPDSLYGYGIPDYVKAFDGVGIADKGLHNPKYAKGLIAVSPLMTNSLFLRLAKPLQKSMTVGVFTLQGKRVFSQVVPLKKNSLTYTVPGTGSIAAGTYIVKIKTAEAIVNAKVYKVD